MFDQSYPTIFFLQSKGSWGGGGALRNVSKVEQIQVKRILCTFFFYHSTFLQLWRLDFVVRNTIFVSKSVVHDLETLLDWMGVRYRACYVCLGFCRSSLSLRSMQLPFPPVIFRVRWHDMHSESDFDLWFDDLCFVLMWLSQLIGHYMSRFSQPTWE